MLHSEPVKLHGELNVANESVHHELRHMVLRGLTSESLIAPHNKKGLLDQIALSCFSCVFTRVPDVNSVVLGISVFHFRVDFCLCVETSLRAKAFTMMKMCFPTGSFSCKSNSCFARRLVLKQRHEVTWKWPILLVTQHKFCFVLFTRLLLGLESLSVILKKSKRFVKFRNICNAWACALHILGFHLWSPV